MADTPLVNIVGESVALGPYRRDLIPLYQRWFNDFVTLRGLAHTPQPMTLEAETAWYDSVVTNRANFLGFTIFERTSWRPIGVVNWHGIDYRHRYGIASTASSSGKRTREARVMAQKPHA